MGADFSVEAPALLAAAKRVAKALDPRKAGQSAVLVASQDGVQLMAATPQLCISVPVHGSLTVTTPGSVRGPLQHIFTTLADYQGMVHLHAVTEVSEPGRLALLPALAEPGTQLTLLDKGSSSWEEVTSQILARREQTTVLSSEALKLVTRQVAYAAEADPCGHPPLSGVLLTLGDGQLTATATDVFRLAHASVPCPASLAAPVVLAPAVLHAVLRVFAHSETLHLTATVLTEQVIAQEDHPLHKAVPRERIVRLCVRDAAASAAAATSTIELVPIYGTYPDVTKALVPNRTESREVMVRRAALRAALGTLISSLGKAWRQERITLHITDAMLHLQADSTVIDLPLLPGASTEAGEPVSITLRTDKLKELLDALHAARRISSDELILHVTKLALHAAPCSTSEGFNVHHILPTALYFWELT